MDSNTEHPPAVSEQSQTIIPPAPPSVESNAGFTPGKFLYVNEWDRPFVVDAYQVISRNEWWAQFKQALQSRGVNEKTGFQFSNDPFYNKIMSAISNTRIGGGHSGASMGSVMRSMEVIALHGEDEYRRQIIEYEATKRQNQMNELARQRESAAAVERHRIVE